MRTLVNDLQHFTNGTRYRPALRYSPNFAELSSQLVATFEPSTNDEETSAFLNHSANELSLPRLLLADVLRCLGVSRTTSNGLLGIGGMFVLSTEQCRRLLRPASQTGVAGTEALPVPSKAASELADKTSPNPDESKEPTDEAQKAVSGMALIPSLPLSHRFASLLDIGAGDGGVTAKLAPLFTSVYATEYSMSMRYRLRRRGYTVLDHVDPFHYDDTAPSPRAPPTKDKESGSDDEKEPPITRGGEAESARSGDSRRRRLFDVITCLNVLDRADHPLTLLRDMRDSLTPNGMLVLAVVLPWCPFVEYNAQQHAPTERLPMEGGLCCRGASFEESANVLVQNVLLPVGFELVRWTKVPYLCMGNLRVEYAVLHDAVFILKRKENFVDTAYTVTQSQSH